MVVYVNNEKLKEIIANNDLNVKKVAALLCVTETTVYRWLRNTRPMSNHRLHTLKLILEHDKKTMVFSDQWRIK